MYTGIYMLTNTLTWKLNILKPLALVKMKTETDKSLE